MNLTNLDKENKNLLNEKWLFLNTGVNDGIFNMALDNYLLESLVSSSNTLPVLRVYSWIFPAYTIGANQVIPETVKSVFLDHQVVRRLSGGQAVLHSTMNNELTYSVCIRYKKNFKKLYFEFGKVLINFLSLYGLNSQIGHSDNNYFKHFNCFETKTYADIVMKDIKIIASAQYRKNGCVLQHGSVRLDKIKELSGIKITFEDAVNKLKRSFETSLNIKFLDYTLRLKDKGV